MLGSELHCLCSHMPVFMERVGAANASLAPPLRLFGVGTVDSSNWVVFAHMALLG
jgi:hypothetical protein